MFPYHTEDDQHPVGQENEDIPPQHNPERLVVMT